MSTRASGLPLFAVSGDGAVIAYYRRSALTEDAALEVKSHGRLKTFSRGFDGNSMLGLSRDGHLIVFSPKGRQRTVALNLVDGRRRSFLGYSVWGQAPLSANGRYVTVRRGDAADGNHNLRLRDVGVLDLRTGRYKRLPGPGAGRQFGPVAISGDGTTVVAAWATHTGANYWKSISWRAAKVESLGSGLGGGAWATAISDDGGTVLLDAAPGAFWGGGIPVFTKGSTTPIGIIAPTVVPYSTTISRDGDTAVFMCAAYDYSGPFDWTPPINHVAVIAYNLDAGTYSRIATIAPKPSYSVVPFPVGVILTADGKQVVIQLAQEPPNSRGTVDAFAPIMTAATADATSLGSQVPPECAANPNVPAKYRTH